MADLRLEFTGYEYWDRSQAIINGTVKPKGIDLVFHRAPADLFLRQFTRAEFPASEMSTSFLTTMHDRGDTRLYGLPLFTARDFFHSRIFVRSDAGINKPEDLKGRRFGFPDYQMTAAVWIRGLLHHEWGVTARDVHWFQGGFERPGYVQRVPLDLPPDISLTTIPQDRSIMQMLLDGELDAVASPSRPQAFVEGNPKVKRLIPDYREMEKDYYKRTRLFPASHIVVLRKDVYDENPWVARSLVDAYIEARDIGWRELQNVRILSLPWLADDLEEIREVFGGEHPFPYGYKGSQVTVNALVHYLHEQGITKRVVDPKELFPPIVLDT